MDAEKAAKNLKVIRQLMERPIRYSATSGLSGIVAGAAALAGLGLDWLFWSANRDDPRQAMCVNLAVWGAVFLAALAAVTVLTVLRERRQRIPFWSPVKRRILSTILPPFVAAVGLTGAIVLHWYGGIGPNQWGLIPAIWMCLYGLACWQVGGFSIPELRVMGAAFLLAGVATAFAWQVRPYTALGATFGGFHLVYGVVVCIRHGL